jgi:peptidoglycan/LPS O-acetylase OafA/YrhL
MNKNIENSISTGKIDPMTKSEGIDRVPELDGIRGLAILLVLFFHILRRAANLTNNDLLHSITDIARIGWIGVDIFFVLSGFLITSILLKTKEQPGYFKKFYVRRILRIFPLYYIVIVGLLFFLPALDPDLAISTQAVWPFFILHQQNWLYIVEPFPSGFLVVTWSLAIEEQFYLIWPAIVKFFNKRQLVFAGVGIILFSLLVRIILMIFAIGLFPVKGFLYYGTVTRFEALAAGALVAIAFQSSEWKSLLGRHAKLVFILSILGFAAVLFRSSFSPVSNNSNLTIWGYTLLALIGSTLIIMVSTQPENSWIRLAFRNKILSFFGKYSYAIYLLHMPILLVLWNYFTDAKRQSFQVWLIFVLVSFFGTIIASLLTWHLLEKHALGLKKYFE